ncbi:MAG: winged helix-turn-helix transcriptional regulator, partial [Lachnospiraceae bacterium]|nr:winged helix-turn-helix transcriptional regulator [Lachnospiraceae bacterium]
ELRMNPDSFSLKVNETPVELTKHEFRILELLVKNPTRAFTKQNIYEFVWDDSYFGEDKTINVHISNIRKKLKAVTTVDYIETVWGIGFKLANL